MNVFHFELEIERIGEKEIEMSVDLLNGFLDNMGFAWFFETWRLITATRFNELKIKRKKK